MMETIKVKEEVVEVIVEEDADHMSVSNTSDSDSPSMNMQRKPWETKKDPDWTLKKLSSHTHNTQQGSSDDMEKSASHIRKRALEDQFYDHLEAESPVMEQAKEIQAKLTPEFPSFIKTMRSSHATDHLEAESPVMERAKEIQAKLTPEFPSFIKTMRSSHVTDRFGIRFPREFCCSHLPPHDTTVNLVDERGEENIVNIHADRAGRCGLSGGWKKFSIANKLLDGDVLVFQLVKPSKFKVHIVRANGPAEVNSFVIGKFVSYKGRGALVDQFCDDLEAKSPVIERAKEFQANLAPEFPSFIKIMLPSHVTCRFGMRLPKEFCYLHLSPHDSTVHLVDESGDEYIVNIHVEVDGRYGISGGWKKFSIANKLLEGDVVVFQLVNPSKFKVFTVRANGLTKGDGALGLLNLDAHASQSNFNERIARPLPMDIVLEKMQQENPKKLNSYQADQSEIGSEDLGSAMPDFIVDSMEMGKIENFTIFLNGSIINSELSEDHKTKYYQLCCTRKSFLHNHLLETITCKLAAEIISQTVNIAEAIRACKLSTPRAEYLTWDKTLEGFELLGMDVGFLRAKISRLLSLAFESKEAVDSKRFKEAKVQQSCAIYELRTLELKCLDLKKVVKRLDLEMETLKVNAERHELKFQDEVNASWL